MTICFTEISERKRAEQALRESEERFRAIVSNTPDHIIVQDRDLRYRFVANPQLGLSETDMLGKTDRDLLEEEDAEKLTALKTKVLQTGEPLQVETSLQNTRGETEFFEGAYRPVLDSAGQVDGLVGYFRNITQRKRAEEELHRNEEVLRLFVEHSPAALAMFDRDMKYIAASHRHQAEFQLDDQELVGRTHYEVFPEIPERWKEIHRRCLAGAIGKCDQDPFPRGDGHLDWVRWEIHPWREATGEIGGIILFSEVITEQVQTQEEMRRRADELAALNTLGRRISRMLSVDEAISQAIEETYQAVQPDLAFIFLREGERLQLKGVAPSGYESLFAGITARCPGECICGLAVSQGRFLYSRDILTDTRCTWEECRKAGLRSFAALPLRSGEGIIGMIGLAAWEERDFEAQADFLETLADQVSTGIGNALLHERTLRHAAGLAQRVAERTAELEIERDKAQAADRVKSVFLATMSHELRTPLNSIIGFTGVMLQGLVGPLSPEQVKQLGMVQNSARHLLALINDVLDISKIEAGQVEVACEPCDLRAEVERVVQTVAPLAEKKGLTLEIELAPQVGPIISDRRRVEQVLLNLVNNAVKFTDRGSVNVIADLVPAAGSRQPAISHPHSGDRHRLGHPRRRHGPHLPAVPANG